MSKARETLTKRVKHHSEPNITPLFGVATPSWRHAKLQNDTLDVVPKQYITGVYSVLPYSYIHKTSHSYIMRVG